MELFLLLLILLNASTTQSDRPSGLLSRLLSSKFSPMLVVLDGHTSSYSNLNALGLNLEEQVGLTSVEEGQPNDQNAYMLYHLLRTAQKDEQLDDSVENKFEDTKQVLRSALRARCQMLLVCVQLCPKKKPKCPKKCQQKYDDYDACEEIKKPKQCKPPRCGRTMPPKWLRILK